ncbi:MAG: right-handed parallel beta-helix repeat-containing protein [Pseudohongiella sp.]|uniref:hypothetical protein n=1 Tax=Pseudohongiella sp. TaxID=1979412 RepID=UPI0034A01C19
MNVRHALYLSTAMTGILFMAVADTKTVVRATAMPPLSVELPNDAGLTQASGRTLRVGPDDSLQQALNQAGSGDIIELEAGARYYGPFVLRQHAGPDWITIVSRSDNGLSLPDPGTRVSPSDAGAMATLVASGTAVIKTDPAAARYRFIGIEIKPGNRGNVANHVAGTRRTTTNLVELSSGDNSLAQMPHHIVFERSYLHGDPVYGTRRGVVMNGAHIAVIDSHLSGFKSMDDAQAVAGWEGTGPFLIRNNYLEAAGENLMFGGADPAIKHRVPSDISILGNHFSKPLSWQRMHPSHDGSTWTVKNLLELKNAQRVLIEGNLFEHNWAQSQNGFAILFTVRNQDGGSPWSRVQDVTFTNNIVRHVGAGISILGRDNLHRSHRSEHLTISNNLFYDIGDQWGNGRLFQLLNSPANIVINNNTAMQTDAIIWLEGDPIPGAQIRNNIFMHNSTGISGTGTAPGTQSLNAYLESPAIITGNILIGADRTPYPDGIRRVRESAAVGFVNAGTSDYRLRAAADEHQGASAEITPGVDFDLLCAALSVSERPAYCFP